MTTPSSFTWRNAAAVLLTFVLAQQVGCKKKGEEADHFHRGVEHSRQSEYDAAIKEYTLAIEINPNLIVAYFNRGHAYSKKGDHNAAIRDFSKTIKLNPKNVEAYKNRAVSHFFKKDYDKAWQDVKKYQEPGKWTRSSWRSLNGRRGRSEGRYEWILFSTGLLSSCWVGKRLCRSSRRTSSRSASRHSA
jgi:tetratricopeptide (TPR) repeat protein